MKGRLKTIGVRTTTRSLYPGSALQALLNGAGKIGFAAVLCQINPGGLNPRDQRPDDRWHDTIPPASPYTVPPAVPLAVTPGPGTWILVGSPPGGGKMPAILVIFNKKTFCYIQKPIAKAIFDRAEGWTLARGLSERRRSADQLGVEKKGRNRANRNG